MPLFGYESLDGVGNRAKGLIDADSYEMAKERLKKQGVVVLSLFAYEKKRREIALKGPLLIAFTRELSQLLSAGLPLYECLLAIEEKFRAHKAHPLFLKLCDEIKHGRHLSDALSLYPKTFRPIYCSMVAAGEKMGALAEVFSELAEMISRGDRLKKRLKTALIYPAFLLAFSFLAIGALFFFLIPSMRDLFSGRELHPLTKMALSISDFLINHQIALLSSFFVCAISLLLLFYRGRGKEMMSSFLLKLPLMKRLVTWSVLIRFARALSMLLGSGVPVIEALRLSREVMYHHSFEEVIKRAESHLIEGKKLSDELALSPLIPNLFVRMVKTGEEVGNTSEMLSHIALIYEEDLKKSLSELTEMIQPVLLLTLGIVIAFVLLSVLIPLTDVGSLVQ